MHCCRRAAVYFRLLLLRLIKYFQRGCNNLVLSSWVYGEVMGSQVFRHQLFLSYKISDFTQRKICCLPNSSWNSRVIRKKDDPTKEVYRAFIRSAGDSCLISFFIPCLCLPSECCYINYSGPLFHLLWSCSSLYSCLLFFFNFFSRVWVIYTALWPQHSVTHGYYCSGEYLTTDARSVHWTLGWPCCRITSNLGACLNVTYYITSRSLVKEDGQNPLADGEWHNTVCVYVTKLSLHFRVAYTYCIRIGASRCWATSYYYRASSGISSMVPHHQMFEYIWKIL